MLTACFSSAARAAVSQLVVKPSGDSSTTSASGGGATFTALFLGARLTAGSFRVVRAGKYCSSDNVVLHLKYSVDLDLDVCLLVARLGSARGGDRRGA